MSKKRTQRDSSLSRKTLQRMKVDWEARPKSMNKASHNKLLINRSCHSSDDGKGDYSFLKVPKKKTETNTEIGKKQRTVNRSELVEPSSDDNDDDELLEQSSDDNADDDAMKVTQAIHRDKSTMKANVVGTGIRLTLSERMKQKREHQKMRTNQIKLARTAKLLKQPSLGDTRTTKTAATAITKVTTIKSTKIKGKGALTTNQCRAKAVSTDRVRKHRLKWGPEGWAKKRAADKAYIKKRKENGQVKNIVNLTKREKQKKRKGWCEYSRRYRQKKATIAAGMCESFTDDVDDNLTNHIPVPVLYITPKESKSTLIMSRKRKLEADLRAANEKIARLERSVDRWRKSRNRKTHSNKITPGMPNTPSPNSKVNKILEDHAVTPMIRRKLLLSEILQSQMTNARLVTKTSRKARLFYHRLFCNDMLLRSKLITHVQHLISCKQYSLRRKEIGLNLSYEIGTRNNVISREIRSSVKQFLELDINSRMCPGVKDKKTLNKIVFQKRILLSSMKLLHVDYCKSTQIALSLSSFRRLRPKWIFPPSKSDRETCLCLKHSNTQLLVGKLHQLKLVECKNADDICKTLCCIARNKDCMLRNCVACASNIVTQGLKDNERNDTVSYDQWQTRNEDRIIKGDQKTVRLVEKVTLCATKSELVECLTNVVPEFLRHVFTIRHQYSALKSKKDGRGPDEAIIHCDFAENYILKYHVEIQAMHFGASKKQMSMHTGVLYYMEGESKKTQAFCTVSQNLDHGVHAIWAHLRPILVWIQQKCPLVTSLHFLSDGPTSQYKNKTNVFMLTTMLPCFNHNIVKATWNYSEAGHGKGAMDGVGGVLKRTADRLTLHGTDVATVQQFVDHITVACPGVLLYQIDSSDMKKIKEWMPNKGVPSVPSIMKLHQFGWSFEQQNSLYLREFSCFDCSVNEICSHHKLGRGIFQTLLAPDSILKSDLSRSSEQLAVALTESACPEPVIDAPNLKDPAHSTSPAINTDLSISSEQLAVALTESACPEPVIDAPNLKDPAHSTSPTINTDLPRSSEQLAVALAESDCPEPTTSLVPDLNARNVVLGDTVSVAYNNNWYPALVESISIDPMEQLVEVNFMEIKGANKFAWPKRVDKLFIINSDILCAVAPLVEHPRYWTMSKHDFSRSEAAYNDWSAD